MNTIVMVLKYVVPRFGIPSLPKPICVGYRWDSGLVDFTAGVWIYITLSLEDYGRLRPRALQLAVSFIPKDKSDRQKISQRCYAPDHEKYFYGLTIIHDLGLFRREKRLGVIELLNGEQSSSFVPYSNQGDMRSLFIELIGEEFLGEDFILNQFHLTCDDARFGKNNLLAHNRLTKRGLGKCVR